MSSHRRRDRVRKVAACRPSLAIHRGLSHTVNMDAPQPHSPRRRFARKSVERKSTEIRAVRRHSITDAPARIGDTILELLGRIPDSTQRAVIEPQARAQAIAEAAARRAALLAGGLALPPGPLGWLTVLPELYAIWKLQAQMVADIAGAYGLRWRLTREQMLFCLFRHTAAQALRDIAVRAGQRWLVQTATLGVLRGAARSIGVRLSQRALGRGIARWLPVVGAMSVGAYAWYDTRQVGRTAIDLFAAESAAGAALGDPGGY